MLKPYPSLILLYAESTAFLYHSHNLALLFLQVTPKETIPLKALVINFTTSNNNNTLL